MGRWTDALVEVQLAKGTAMIWMIKKAWQITACILGALIGVVVTSSLIGLYVADNPKGFIHFAPCYAGRQVVLALGTPVNVGFMHINVPEWGPPYFRVKMDALTWPGGAVGFNRNNVGICPDTANADTIYEAKAGWIEAHNKEWIMFIKVHPEEGKKWYGRQWKRILRQINQQPKMD